MTPMKDIASGVKHAAHTRRPQLPRRSPRAARLLIASAISAAPAGAGAVEYVCPPPPEGVYGLPGGPKFAESPAPDTFASQLDDPRWNGNYRHDFSDASSTEAAVRMLKEGDALFLSFEARVDPDGATPTVDGVYLAFSKDGNTAVMTKVMLTAAAPLQNSGSVSTSNWWKTTDGGATPWPKQTLPQTWATSTNVHAWSGSGSGGTATGSSWAVNAKLSLTALGSALGLPGPLGGPFKMWFEIAVHTTAGPIPYDWPAGATLGFNTGPSPCSGSSPCAVLPVNTFGEAFPAAATSCPKGIKIDPMSIGVLPLSGGIPGTSVHYGSGTPANDFVAVMTDTSGAAIATNSIEGRFRIANWGSQIGVGGDWKDMVVDASNNAVLGVNATTGTQVTLHCANPPYPASTPRCFQLPAGAPHDQCLLVELAQHNGSGATFVSSSARRNMDFVNASTFQRSAEISIRGLAPLAGSPGTRDVYLYVRTLNMPAETRGNPSMVIPEPVPPRAAIEGNATHVPVRTPPRYRQDTYERIASVMPTYEVHVYHDTGRTRDEDGTTRRILAPQAPFGYFVRHQGDLSGWRHALTGEGFVLAELSPNFYHAKIPDNGSVQVRTKIESCERVLFGLVNRCGDGGCSGCTCTIGGTDGTGPLGLLTLLAVATLLRLRRRSGTASVRLAKHEPPR